VFSGIIERVGRVRTRVHVDTALRLGLDAGYPDLELGESVAVNGVCITVVRRDGEGRAEFYVSSETLARSNLSALALGAPVNLERAVSLSTRLSGHLVQGHVDGRARLVAAAPDGEARRLTLSLPAALAPYCVEKGSIALNGVSLTLNRLGAPGAEGTFTAELVLIPHTWAHTNLRYCAPGDELNVEVDVLAKYVERLCHAYLTPSNA
jgi:riboflavin synthase